MKIIKYIVILVVAISINSCEGDLDVNLDPLAAPTVDPNLLFPEILVNFSSIRTVELNSVNIQAQHWASGGSAGVFSNPERYALSIFTTGNSWTRLYANNLKNLTLAKNIIEENNPEDVNIIGQVKIMEAFIYYNITLLWENVPFTEAVKPEEFQNPKFEQQEDILRGIIALIDEAVPLLKQEGSDVVDGGDLIYNGDLENWEKFGNTIKLKALMLIANVSPESVASEIQSLSQEPLIIEVSEEAKLDYTSTPSNENPIWRTLDRFAGGSNAFWFAGSTLVDMMNEINDPRRATYFDFGTTTPEGTEDEITLTEYIGQDQGIFETDSIATVSLNIIRPEMPDRYATASETLFLLADATAKGYISGGLAQAETFFRNGLRSSLNFYDGKPGAIDSETKENFISSIPSLTTLANDEAIKLINEQHYIDLFSRGLEAWTLWRRTKTPDLQLPDRARLPDIIRRYSYPPAESGSNSNAPVQPPLQTPMWFEGS